MMKRQGPAPLRLSQMVPGGGLQQSTPIPWPRDSYNVQRTLQVSCRKRADATPNNFLGYITAGEAMRVTLVASAHNGNSEPLVLEVSWDGRWSAELDEMQRHLVIKPV